MILNNEINLTPPSKGEVQVLQNSVLEESWSLSLGKVLGRVMHIFKGANTHAH